ncbi:DNA mismatch repair protein Mlh3-like isoform X2 [Thalassophryne amazonica]|uniref:DNA mismatch repair protein Mlh3-like isoform X2 n=1 Tax=Thalassophryne amazonica TaxID=390379 RepID=UPI0014725357|nr:DNA mismatch repair protein Mlh3-like isoform X2 [Thalassophryne amazonica]
MAVLIKRLPTEVQGKLRSGVAIPSLQQCVEELVLNSIDAEATCVGVRVDLEAFKVQVVDNGQGMSAEDVDRVGNRYYTSKCSCLEDLDHLRFYGFRGEAVASIVSFAKLVEISSRSRTSAKTHVKIFKDGKGLDVFEAESIRPSAGTTVVICNFFHNMPVRRRRMDTVLEGERIRHRVEAVSLMHPSVSFTMKNDCTGVMMVQLPKARSTYYRFVQIHSLGRAQKLGEVSHIRGQFEVIGYIGREGHYNNSLQFLYVNNRLLLKTRIHKLLNVLLRRLSASNQKNDNPDGQAPIRSPKHKRGQELHGVYIINIKCAYSEYDICLDPAKTLIEFKDWDGILLCIEEAVNAFLSRENLVVSLSPEDLENASSTFVGTVEHGNNGSEDIQAAVGASTLDCCIGLTLASQNVHRKHHDDFQREDYVCQESKGEEELRGQENLNSDKVKMIHGNEALCDLEIDSEREVAQVEKPTSGNIEEGCESAVGISGRHLEEKQLESAKLREMRVISQDSINKELRPDSNGTEKILPNSHDTGGHELMKRKISLSDPYVHESLKTRNMSQNCWTMFQQHSSGLESEGKAVVEKCKISLTEDSMKTHAPAVPLKIPKILACQKLCFQKGAASLDKFRRIYGKSGELKIPSVRNNTCHLLNPARCSRTDGFGANPKNLLVSQKGLQKGNVTDIQSNLSSSSVLSKKAKSFSGQNRAKEMSLAAKLCLLRQDETKASQDVLTSMSRTTSQDTTCVDGANGGIQVGSDDSHCDAAPDPEAIPCCSTNAQLLEREEAPPLGDWIHHYDPFVGKTVYVNKVTGLSRYEDPPTEEMQAQCTSDVTNLAVSVVTETGMEYRCYPFQVALVLPFLPKSRADRVISSGRDVRDDDGEVVNSLSSLYSKWNNPVFVRPPRVGVDISSGQANGLAVKIHNILFPYRFSKSMIHSMKVINQVNKKFLACLINAKEDQPPALKETEGNLLVLVDQHAAHERVRLESLIADSYEDDSHAPGERRLRSSTILPLLEISATEDELRLLRSCQPHFRSLGLEVKFSHAGDLHVLVGKVPMCFVEKESNELRRGRPSVIRPIVEEYLQEQIELLRSAGRVRGTLPLTVLKVLASLACHGAIKFNDSLSRDECCSLVASLSACQLPFQCAHGRPSIVPLVDILHLDRDQEEILKPNLQKLRGMYKTQQLFGNT